MTVNINLRNTILTTLIILLLAIVLGWAVLRFGINPNTQPKTIGLNDSGQLQPCPNTPNCVSSQAQPTDAAYISPLTVDGDAPISKVKAVLPALGEFQVIREDAGYMHVVITTPLTGYRDDLELLQDPQDPTTLHVRSASRLGRSDFGANRKRVEALREALAH